MVYKESILHVPDNSNVMYVKLIKVLKNKNQHGKIGNDIIVSVQIIKKEEERKINKGDVLSGVIIQTKKRISRKQSGYFLCFNKNCCVVFTKNKTKLTGSRLFVPVPKELRYKNQMKILTIAPCII